ncbi:MAG: hypothetical protein Q9157_003964 [Trypethelium eluteriae]
MAASTRNDLAPPRNNFPSPQLRIEDEPSSQILQEFQQSSQSSQTANKENDPPPSTSAPTSNSEPTLSSTTYASLPPPLLSLLNSITKSLTTSFAQQPPHTVQRLAELVLHPRAHYRYLGPYLNALDRVVSVSSPTTHFPLPQATIPAASGSSFLQNGDNGSSQNLATSNGSGGLGSDESLGGALLTPIPWLRPSNGGGSGGEIKSELTETIDGPNGAGRIETVSVTLNGVSSTSPTSPNTPTLSPTAQTDGQLRNQGAVTQGELLRQEQEAGVVPESQARRRAAGAPGGGLGITGVEGGPEAVEEQVPQSTEEQETPHARGPEVIGMEDMGPQGKAPGSRLDMEAAVGRPKVEEKNDQLAGGDEASGEQADQQGTRDENRGTEPKDEDSAMVDVPEASTAKDESKG